MEVCSSADVGEDDCFACEFGEELFDILDMDVFTEQGAVFVLWFEEGTFGDEDFGVHDFITVEMWSREGVAEEGYDWDSLFVGDFLSLFFEFDEFGLGESCVFFFEFGSSFDDGVADGWYSVVDLEHFEEEVIFDLYFIFGVEVEDDVFCLLSFEVDPALHHVSDGGCYAGVADTGSYSHTLESSL